MPGTDVLLYVEDPGAANYLAEVPATLAGHGWRAVLLAGGAAGEYLHRRGLEAAPPPSPSSADDILAAFRPRALLVGTAEDPATLGLALVAAARRAGIVSVGAVDLAANAAHRFRGRSDAALTYAPDWLLVPDARTRDDYIALGYPGERIAVCGHPHYDYVRAAAADLAGEGRAHWREQFFPRAGREQVICIFAAEVSTGLDPQQYQRSPAYTLAGRGPSVGRTAVVLDEFLDAVQTVAPRPYLVLRLHPKNTAAEFAAYQEEFDQVSAVEPGLPLVYAADLIVGMTSLLLFEAALLGRPTLSIVPRAGEQDWLPSVRLGLTLCVTTREQLRAVLPAMVAQGPQGPQGPLTRDDGIVWGALPRIGQFFNILLQGTGHG